MFKFGQKYISENIRVFRIDVGTMDSADIEQYIRRIRNEFNLPIPRNLLLVSDV